MSDPTNTTRTTGAETAGSAGHQLACLFASREAAERAVSALEHDGIPRDRIDLIDQTGASTAGTASAEESGFWESLKRFFTGDDDYSTYQEGVRRGHVMLRVRAATASEADRATDVLERFEPIDIDEQEAGWRREGREGGPVAGDDLRRDGAVGAASFMAPTGTPAIAPAATGGGISTSSLEGSASLIGASGASSGAPSLGAEEDRIASGATAAPRATPAAGGGALSTGAVQREGVSHEGEEVIPVVEERIRVGKRDTARGSVRVRAYTIETPVEEEVRLRTERVAVERRPVDRGIAPGAETFRDRTVEMTEREEEAVVAKDARVVEEVVVRKDVGERTETVRDTTRRTEVEVEDETRLAARTGRGGASPAGASASGGGGLSTPDQGISGHDPQRPGVSGNPTGRRDGTRDDDLPRDTMQGDVRGAVHGSRAASEADPASMPPTGEYERPSGEGHGGR